MRTVLAMLLGAGLAVSAVGCGDDPGAPDRPVEKGQPPQKLGKPNAPPAPPPPPTPPPKR
jgi:hypothetical protein